MRRFLVPLMKKFRPQMSTGMVNTSWMRGEVERIDSVVDDGRQRQTHRQHMGHPDVQHQRAANQRDNQPPFADGVGECNADFLRVGKAAGKKPVLLTISTSICSLTEGSHRTVALLVAGLTLTWSTPVGAPQARSTEAEQAAQVIPLRSIFDVFGLREHWLPKAIILSVS